MFKIVIFIFIAVWAISLFFGKRRRIIRDIYHLLQLIFFAVLVFTTTSLLHSVRFFAAHPLYYALAVGCIFLLSWPLSRIVSEYFAKKR